ncbi:MAG: hypothetical protein ACKOC5_17575 [Chloroflexota bacterium]
MIELSLAYIERLIRTESAIHYGVLPPTGRPPFIYLDRGSPVLLSAPHGCRTYRGRSQEGWHDEDEYTAGMALLLSELLGVSVIATIWMTPGSDPNDTYEEHSPYKQTIRRLAERGRLRAVLDLHGAGQDSPNLAPAQLVDLGAGPLRDSGRPTLPAETLAAIRGLIERRLGAGSTQRGAATGFPAAVTRRTVTAFAAGDLGLQALQIEMKPSVRVPWRRADATLYGRHGVSGGPYAAEPQDVLSMLHALVEVIEYLHV